MSVSACCTDCAEVSGTRQKLLGLLADGGVHSGTELAARLGVTRAAVWKSIHQLDELGVSVKAEKGQGYRLSNAIELFDEHAIRSSLTAATEAKLDKLEVLWETTSTNDYLLQQSAPGTDRSRVCLAEIQTGGRGRRGRRWVAEAGQSICLSLAWSFSSAPAQLACLGLVAGVAVLRVARQAGAADALLKWPNDVVIDGGKLAGILIDVQGEAGGPMRTVVGVGLNYGLPGTAIDKVLADGGLMPASLCGMGVLPELSRNAAAAALVNELHAVFELFRAEGFSGLADEWRSADFLCGKAVTVSADNHTYRGTVRGIANDGRLQLETDAGIIHLLSGDVSVRPQENIQL